MTEIWKDIKNYEGLYQVSNLGRIRSFYNYKRNGNNILTPQIKRGYYQVGLRKDKKRKWYQLHRLIATAFIPNPKNLPQVNHKDENKTNNSIDNLEWCTVSYNNCYGTRLKRVKEKTSRAVLQYDLKGNFIKEYNSLSEASVCCNIKSPGNITECCKGKYKQAGGFIWKYKEGDNNANG